MKKFDFRRRTIYRIVSEWDYAKKEMYYTYELSGVYDVFDSIAAYFGWSYFSRSSYATFSTPEAAINYIKNYRLNLNKSRDAKKEFEPIYLEFFD